MHKIWLVNLEEVLGQGLLKETLFQHFSRYLLLCEKGDIFITSVDLSSDFINYAARMNGLSSRWDWLLRVKPENPYFLWQSVLNDRYALDLLKKSAVKGNHRIDPFIETPGVISLADRAGLKAGSTKAQLVNEGLIHRLNDKVFFRDLSKKLGIPIAPGYGIHSISDLRKAIIRLTDEGADQIILKKSFSGGGYGNIAGTAEILNGAVNSWYDGSPAVAEKLMPIECTLGSLIILKEDGIEFVGLNSQIIENNSWKGCRYPFDLQPVSYDIKLMCIAYGEHIWRMGARGLLNVDFGLTRDSSGRLCPFALEINLRRNGFNYILQVARRFFDIPPEDLKVLYYSHFKLPDGVDNFKILLRKTRSVKIDGKPILPLDSPLKRGIVFTTAVKRGCAGVLAAGSTDREVDAVMETFKRGLAEEGF